MHVVAAHSVAFAHFGDVLFGIAKGFEGCFLTQDRSTEHGVLMNFHHGFGELGRSTGEAETESGHGPGFGKAVQIDGAFAHAGNFQNAGVRLIIGELAVDFVGDDDEVVLDGEFGNLPNLFLRQGGSGRVGRVVEHQQFGFLADLFLQRFAGEFEVVLFGGFYSNGYAMSKDDDGIIRDVARLVIEHFVAGFNQGADGEIHGLADADGDEDFGVGVVFDASDFVDVTGNFFAKAG